MAAMTHHEYLAWKATQAAERRAKAPVNEPKTDDSYPAKHRA